MNLKDAQAAADRLEFEARSTGLDHVYDDLDATLRDISNQIDITTYLPSGADARLGMAAGAGNGRRFFELLRKDLRDSLCEDGGDFAELAKSGLQATAGTIVVILSGVMRLPPDLNYALVPLSVLISIRGVKAFCAPPA